MVQVGTLDQAMKYRDRVDLAVAEMVHKVKVKPEPQIQVAAVGDREIILVIQQETVEAE